MSDPRLGDPQLSNPRSSDPQRLDRQLSALFSQVGPSADFDARLMQRLQIEAADAAQAAERAKRTLEWEQLRHGIARRELRGPRGWMQSVERIVTLERIGVTALAIGVITSAYSSSEHLRQFLPTALTLVGILLAAAPLLATARLRWK